jgi:glycine cleavage system H protein
LGATHDAVAERVLHEFGKEGDEIDPKHKLKVPANAWVNSLARNLVVNLPDDLKYAKTHEWVKVEGDTAVVGITDHAQSELGDIVYVERPEAGRQLSQGDTFGTVESVKTVSDLYAPVSGEVVEVNDSLESEAEVINSDPYSDGWILKIKMSNPDEVQNLLDASAYESSVDE